MKKIILIVILFKLFHTSEIKSQITQEWVSTYNGSGTGVYYSTKNRIDNSGNMIVGGNCSTDTDDDLIILKYNTSGELLWSRRYDGPIHNSEHLKDIILDDSGNIYVTGSTNEEQSGGYYNWLTIKYSPEGDIRWVQTLDWTLHKEDIPFSITLDKDRNIFVAGYGQAPPDGITNFDLLLAKYDNNGLLKWTRSYDSQPFHSDWGYSVVTDDLGNAYISGYSYPSKIITIKYDPDGNQKWLREYPRMTGEYAVPMYSTIDRQNNIIVNGYYEFFNQSIFVTLKYNEAGDLLWDKVFDSPDGNQDVAHAICVDDSMNVYVTGRTQTSNNGHDVLLIKYSPNGDTDWVRTYDNGISESDEGEALAVDDIGNIYITGETQTIDNSDNCLTLSFSSAGDLKWSKTYSMIGSSGTNSISIDDRRNVFVSGGCFISSNSYAILGIKYSQLTNIEHTTNVALQDFDINNYPNPFNPITKINYTIPKEGNVKIIIYNSIGQITKELVNEFKTVGSYSIIFDGSNLSSGIYYYKIEAGSFVQTKKMLLIK